MGALVLVFNLLGLFCGSVSFAQTSIEITPSRPVDCAKNDYAYVNRVQDVQKVSETETEVVFSFRTYEGFCQTGVFHNRILSRYPTAMVLTDKISFGSVGVKSTVLRTEEDEAVITLSFKKMKVFKKSDHSQFFMSFYPQGIPMPVYRGNLSGTGQYYYPRYHYYSWQIDIRQENGESTLEVNVVVP